MTLRTIVPLVALAGWVGLPTTQAAPKPVSYTRDIVPVLQRSCNGCHRPGTAKGGLDLTSYPALLRGGKHGASVKPRDPAGSRLVEEISGAEPAMPKEGESLSKTDIALFTRWIREGARDDTAAAASARRSSAPKLYAAAPSISALAYSPDGQWLAVSGHHEILLHQADGSGIVARLAGESRRIESLAFSADGKWLAASGGSPAEFGEVQIWDLATRQLHKSFKISNDSLFGISWSGTAEQLAVGGADKTVRLIAAKDGRELLKFDHHSDWVLATAFTLDGQRLVSCSRDKAMKLIELTQGQFVDDVNKTMESWLCLARHPGTNLLACGSEQGTARIYRIAENPGRAANNNDVNLVRQLESQPGPVHVIAYRPDGQAIAVGSTGGEARIYQANDGHRLATLKGHEGAIFALAFHPRQNQLCTGGFEGRLRIFDTITGNLITTFSPVPLQGTESASASATPEKVRTKK